MTTTSNAWRGNPELRKLTRVQEKLFTPEECDMIFTHFPKRPFDTGLTARMDKGEYEIIPSFSNRLETKLDLNDHINHELFGDSGRVAKDFLKEKFSKWIDGDLDQWAKVIRYGVGDFLRSHIDSGEGDILSRRDWTLIIQLSDGDEYEGGDVVIGDWIMPKEKGFTCLFNGGYVPHEITKVTSGERKSFITWFSNQDLTFI